MIDESTKKKTAERDVDDADSNDDDSDEMGEDVTSDEAEEETIEEAAPKAAKKKSKKVAVPKLPGASLRHLRGLGHELEPVVMVGKAGITDSLVRATNAALLTHELIKVRVQGEAPVERREAAAALAEASDAVLAQVLGRTFLLYKRHPKKPKIKLPRGA